MFLLLIVFEIVLIASAFQLAVAIRFGDVGGWQLPADSVPVWLLNGVVVAAVLASMLAMGLYNRRVRESMTGTVVRLTMSVAASVVLLSVLAFLIPPLTIGRGVLALSLALSLLFLVLTRMLFMDLLEQRTVLRRVMVLGAGRAALPLTRLRRRSDLIGLEIVEFVPMPGEIVVVPEARRPLHPGELLHRAREAKVDLVVVAVEERRGTLPMDELLRCRLHGVDVIDALHFLEQESGKLKLDGMHPGWLAFAGGFRAGWLRHRVKRVFDLVVSGALMLLTLPLTLLAALAIRLDGTGGPVLYRQERVGEDGRVFSLFKFRSMRPDAEADGRARWAAAGDDRITPVGRWLRRYRIDELPQLFNVLRGDMSFVGPRPERPEFVSRLNRALPYYAERHRVKPGLTGWAQVCYPYGASEEDAFEKLQFDLYYVKNHSLLLDITVLLQTAEVVLWGKGAR